MSAHTPAPWRVEGRTVFGAKSGHIISHGTNAYGDGPEGYVCNTSGTSEADAALIAAAPDLYDAGDALARFAWSALKADCPEARDNLNTLVGNLRAALMKAEGETK